jgi:hypothetical protein
VLCCKFQCFATNLRWIETQFALIFKILLLMLPWRTSIWPFTSNYTHHIYTTNWKNDAKKFLNERKVSELVMLYGQMVPNISAR